MVGNLRKRLGVVVAINYHLLKKWSNIPRFSFKLLDGILFGNKQTKLDHQSKLDKTTSNSQPIKTLESNPRFVQKIESDSQTHNI